MKYADRKCYPSPLSLPALAGPLACGLFVLSLLATSSFAQSGRVPSGRVSRDALQAPETEFARIPLFNDLGTHQYAISTNSPLAQRYFDQGMRLAWVSELDAARRSFAEAERLDARCAMCAWGLAWTLVPINTADSSEAWLGPARDALERALARSRFGTPREQGMIAALATRLAESRDRAERLKQYTTALAELSERFPDDDHIQLLHAAARMERSGRPYAKTNGALNPHAEMARQTIEVVLVRAPFNPGACLLRAMLIANSDPSGALSCVARLSASLPRILRLAELHSWLCVRTGRYTDAIATAEDAIVRWQRGDTGFAGTTHVGAEHIITSLRQTVSFAAALSGQRELALRASQDAANLSMQLSADSGRQDGLLALPSLTLVTFGEWNAVLKERIPAASTPNARALTMYARGVAFAAKQRWHDAELALGAVRALSRYARTANDRIRLQLASHALSGEIALRKGQPALAAESFRQAVLMEDELSAREELGWYYPVRHSLGLALLAAGSARASADVYEQDLQRFPENGWSLLGLAHALGAQGKRDDARRAHERFAVAFAAADVTVPGSRY